MDTISILATLAGIVMGFGWWPQAAKVYRTKSVEDLSLMTLLLYFPSLLVMTIYGFAITSVPVVVSSVLGVISVGVVLAGYLIYRK